MILLKLLGLANWLREAATALFRLAGRYPWRAAFIAALCLAGWQWHGKGKALGERDAAIAGRKADRAAFIDAQAEAQAKAIAARIADEQRYKDIAHAADTKHALALADARDTTEHFISDGGMRRQAAPSPRGGTAASAEGGSASVPESLPPDTILVAASDVRICTANTIYALGAHDWAAGLNTSD